jgi:two-component sensor histidine kinase
MPSSSGSRLTATDELTEQNIGRLPSIQPYCPPEYDGCELNGDELRIPGQLVTSLTMILHELATNAAKHGTLKSRGGTLKVTWQEEKVGDRTLYLHLLWEEAGANAQIAHRKTAVGYGTTLIDTTIGSLGGTIERLPSDHGFSVRISIPFV